MTCAVSQALNPEHLSSSTLLVALATAVALFGVPHGALDPLVAWRKGMFTRRSDGVWFHMGYIMLAALAGLFWYFTPPIALALFLSISAWHFGRDWRKELPTPIWAAAGALLIILPIAAWPATVGGYFGWLAGPAVEEIATVIGNYNYLFWSMAVAVVIYSVFISFKSSLEFALIFSSSIFVEPLAWFIAYFCWFHSLKHLMSEYRLIPKDLRRLAIGVSVGITTLIIIVAATIVISLGNSATSSLSVDRVMTQVVFIGLFCLTVPHMIVVACPQYRPVTD